MLFPVSRLSILPELENGHLSDAIFFYFLTKKNIFTTQTGDFPVTKNNLTIAKKLTLYIYHFYSHIANFYIFFTFGIVKDLLPSFLWCIIIDQLLYTFSLFLSSHCDFVSFEGNN